MKSNKIFKATFVVMLVTIITRFLGLIRDVLVAYKFGSGMYTDAYNAAVAVPDTVFAIIGLGISTVFIPIISRVKYNNGKKEMFKFANNIISILSVISIVFFVFGMIFTREIVNIIVPGFLGERLELAITLTRISLINLLFLSINVCFLSILQVCEDFILPSILGLFFNLPIIIYLILFKDVSIMGLTIANVVGNFFRVVVQIPSLYKHGFRIKPYIDLKDERIKKMMILVVPVMIGAGANSLNMIVDKNIASSLAVGSISALDYAQKIIVFVNTAITTSIVSIMYPLMSNKLSEGDNEGFLKYTCKSIVTISLLVVPIAAAFILLNKEVVTAFYARGSFDETSVMLTSIALLGYSLQIPFVGVRDILNSSLFSMEKTKVTTRNGIIGVVVNVILSIILSKTFGLLGIAIASTIASMVTAVLLFVSTKKLVNNFKVRDMIVKICKISISAIIMISIVAIFNKFIIINNVFFKLLSDGILGVVVYLILCKVLKIQEFDEFIEVFKRKVNKKEGAA